MYLRPCACGATPKHGRRRRHWAGRMSSAADAVRSELSRDIGRMGTDPRSARTTGRQRASSFQGGDRPRAGPDRPGCRSEPVGGDAAAGRSAGAGGVGPARSGPGRDRSERRTLYRFSGPAPFRIPGPTRGITPDGIRTRGPAETGRGARGPGPAAVAPRQPDGRGPRGPGRPAPPGPGPTSTDPRLPFFRRLKFVLHSGTMPLKLATDPSAARSIDGGRKGAILRRLSRLHLGSV